MPLKENYYKNVEDKSSLEYFMPDGNTIDIKTEHVEAPEILFSPSKIGLEYPGVHEMVRQISLISTLVFIISARKLNLCDSNYLCVRFLTLVSNSSTTAS